MIFATVVKIVLTLATSKMEKKTQLGNIEDIFIFSIFSFIMKNEIVILLLQFAVCFIFKFKFLGSLNQSKFFRLISTSGFAGFRLNQKYEESLLGKYGNFKKNLVQNSHFSVVLNKNINLLYNAAFACLIHKTNTTGSFAKHCEKKFYGPRLHLSVHLLREFYDESFTNIP